MLPFSGLSRLGDPFPWDDVFFYARSVEWTEQG